MYNSFIALLAISALFTLINAKLLKLPATIGLMILGILLSIVFILLKQFMPSIYENIPHLIDNIDFHDFLMDIVLSFLLFAGAVHISIKELNKQRLSVFVFAIIGTLISTIVVGYLSYFAFNLVGIEIELLYCLLFGALISPTDPIAVISIFKNYKVKSSLTMKIEGESLFNDGIGIVIFITIFSMINSDGSDIDLVNVGTLFLREAVGGIVFGLLIGWLSILVLDKIITSPKFAVMTTLVVATLGYALANTLELSGALAMVSSGLLIGNWLHKKSNEQIHRDVSLFWEIIDDVLNSMLFVLMGVSILLIDVDEINIMAAIFAIVIVLFSRFLSVSLPYSFIRISTGKLQKNDLKDVAILTWSGLRGGLAFALALSIGNIANGHFIIFITYSVAVFSIIVQGLSIGKLVKKLYP